MRGNIDFKTFWLPRNYFIIKKLVFSRRGVGDVDPASGKRWNARVLLSLGIDAEGRAQLDSTQPGKRENHINSVLSGGVSSTVWLLLESVSGAAVEKEA